VELRKRFEDCGLELHPDKTKIVYCKDDNRRKTYPETIFVFLGYEFRCREVRNTKNDEVFRSFTPAVSKMAVKLMQAKIPKRTDLSLDDIAKEYKLQVCIRF
jgi:hypothetical protein